MRRVLILGVAALSVASALHAEIEWIDRDWNFGTWSETEGIRTGRTLLVNKTDSSFLIRRVRPTCGCTGVEWSRDPVAPGDTAVVNFSYDPEGRPGPFEKTIKVFLDDSTTPEVIKISGTVIGTDSSLRARYPYTVGPLRISRLDYDFGALTYGDVRHTFISIYNASGQPVTPTLTRIQPGDDVLPVEVALTPTEVAPGDVQTLSLYLNTRTCPLGPLSAVQTLCVGAECLDITIRANILPDTASLTPEQLYRAPQCEVHPDVVDLRKIKRGKKVKVEFEVENTGKEELTLSRVYSSSEAVKVKKYPVHLKSEKRGKVEAEIDTSLVPSDIFSAVIEIVSNDPLKPLRAVRIVGQIKD